MIDHTQAFRLHKTCPNARILRGCDRRLLKKMREFSGESVQHTLGDYLTRSEIEGLLTRRYQIVKWFDDQIAIRGENNVPPDVYPDQQPICCASA